MYTIKDMYDLNETIASDLFINKTYPWEVLGDIEQFILKLGPTTGWIRPSWRKYLDSQISNSSKNCYIKRSINYWCRYRGKTGSFY